MPGEVTSWPFQRIPPRPRRGAREARQHAEEGGLSGAVGAGQDEGRAVVDAEVDVVEHRLRVPHARDVVEQEPRRHVAVWSVARGPLSQMEADGWAERGRLVGSSVDAAAITDG